jgi:hypothetical protein
MPSRFLLAILLISAHLLPLRAVIIQNAIASQTVAEAVSCCPLCVYINDGGCGCGCGEVQQDDGIPSSPDEVPGILQADQIIGSGEELRAFESAFGAEPIRIGAGLLIGAIGHEHNHTFLSRIGIWKN